MPHLEHKLIKASSFAVLAAILFSNCLHVIAKDKASYQMLLPKLDTAPIASEKKKTLKGKIDRSVILDSEPIDNAWGYVPFGTALPQIVNRVGPNTPAFVSGLRPGDKILSAKLSTDKAELVVERDAKKYSCTLLLARVAASNNQDNKTSAAAKALKNHAIYLLVDSSASMNTKDCPGGISRWDWCRNQAKVLYNEGKNVFTNPITITTFNSQFRTHSNCKLEDLNKVFESNIPAGETNMAAVISDAVSSLNSQLYSGKPAVIAIVTDGRPTDVDLLKNKIKQITNELRDPSLLTLAFIEIGNPERYLSELDNDLVKQGAKADIVVVFPFSEVNEQGLAKTMAKAVSSRATANAKPPAVVPVAPRPVPAAADNGDEVAPAPIVQTVKKPSPEELEQARQAKEKRDAEESKIRRAAANNSYTFNKESVHAQRPAAVTPKAAKSPAPAPVVEVDEKESVRHQESNRTYGK